VKKQNLFLTLLLAVFCLSNLTAQNNSKTIWTKVNPALLNSKTLNHSSYSKSSEYYNLSTSNLKNILQTAPLRDLANGKSTVIVDFPIGNNQTASFRIMEAPVMHPDLSAKYPNIKSYVGYGVSFPGVIRFSLSDQKGLSSMLISGTQETVFIEPYTSDYQSYVLYKRADQSIDRSFQCLTDDIPNEIKSTPSNSTLKDANDQTLRTFRLAMSATGEYTAWHGGTKPDALAAINATMTRVNGVYETDFAITMVLIANTDTVIYTNAGSDPYSGFGLNGQLQTALTNNVGEANYDIGHLVHQETNSNGNAGCIGCVCVDNSKGSGYTSHVTPTGDDFDIDYVAHEMGHQFGGNHTFTHSSEGTGVQMEPGSGSTIMGYAGITGSSDVQPHSDPYFHFATIEQITTYVGTTSCQTTTSLSNNPPVADAGNDYTIPYGTAFILEGAATDADGSDVLTYCWEQGDEGFGSSTSVSPTSAGSPSFRSILPTTSPDRYMPQLASVIAGNLTTQWETVLDIAGTMNFSLTVRDNVVGGGQNSIDKMVVTVDGASGPFVVTSQNTGGITWNAGTSETVTWNVAGSNSGAVNTANVDIFLSIDGGYTYPYTLATGVPNNGSASVTVPGGLLSSTARVMVRGAGNIFYAINSTDFAVQNITGISQTTLENNVVIYPNPTTNILTVSFGNLTHIEQLTLTDVQGKVIHQKNNINENRVQLNLSDYSNGIYLLKVQSDESSKTFKVTKN